MPFVHPMRLSRDATAPIGGFVLYPRDQSNLTAFSFNAASPPIYNQGFVTNPADPDTGRGNNQGLEALTASPDGKYLYAMLQSAT